MKYKMMFLGACAFVATAAPAQTTTTTTPAAATTAPVVITPSAPMADAMAKLVAAPAILAAGTSVMFTMDKALASDERDKIKGEKNFPRINDVLPIKAKLLL